MTRADKGAVVGIEKTGAAEQLLAAFCYFLPFFKFNLGVTEVVRAYGSVACTVVVTRTDLLPPPESFFATCSSFTIDCGF